MSLTAGSQPGRSGRSARPPALVRGPHLLLGRTGVEPPGAALLAQSRSRRPRPPPAAPGRPRRS